jgi:hypothetical protein
LPDPDRGVRQKDVLVETRWGIRLKGGEPP